MANSNPTNTFCGWLCLSGLILLMDQASKYTVERTIEYGERVEINSILNIVHMMNPGAAFSLLADAGGWQRYFFIALASGVSVWLVWTMRRRPTRLEAASYSMLLGGALGNLVDRVWRGSVVDFLDFHWSYSHWPAFNLADTAIFIGVCIFIVSTIGSRNHQVHDEGDNSDHENNKGMR
ncbi:MULTISPECIES: signal peptidase II [Shewanella]|uniref:signal peptidase II n=1 Tax=Shewanella TaxID=22 RepID=UPI001FB9BE08|nr:signal peptidase II [Shewanella algae]